MAFNYQAIINSINNFAAKYGLTMYAYTPNFKGVIEALDNLQNIQFTVEDGTIVNADVNANAAIAGTKIDPDFGSQTIETTGVFSAADGAAATPSITFTGDTNTGIYRPGADQLAISTSGTAALTVDSSQRVGIGTASPAGPLEIKYSGNDSGLFITADDNLSWGYSPNIYFRTELTNGGGIGTSGRISSVYESSNNFGMSFYTTAAGSNGEKMRIDSSGNVGVGTTSADGMLHIKGSGTHGSLILEAGGTSGTTNLMYLQGHNNAGTAIGEISFDETATDQGGLTFKTNGGTLTTKMTLTSAGNVGIGTTSPQAITGYTVLTLNNSSQGGAIEFKNNNTSYARLLQGSSAVILETKQNIPIIFGTGTSSDERMRINSLGDVGVGTSAPTYYGGNFRTLEVAGSAGNDGGIFSTVTADNAVKAYFYTESTSDTATIGTVTNHPLLFRTNTAERMRIDSSGNVGIGTNNPLNVLVVSKGGAEGFEVDPGSVTNNNILLHYNRSSSVYVTAEHRAAAHVFEIGASEAARIDSSGTLLLGTSSARTNFLNTSVLGAALQVEGVGFNDSNISMVRNSASGNAPYFILGKTRSGSVGGNTVVANNDMIGALSFQGTDGSEFVEAAQIATYVDGTPGANDMPGRLVFSTTADGASGPTERMRINNAGSLLLTANSGVDNLYSYVAATGTSAVCFRGGHSATAGTPGVGTDSIYIYANGNIQNTNNSYGQISDIKLKENIVDASSQWDDFKAVRFRKYNFKEETGHETDTQLGVVAQELELTSPGLVYETADKDENGNDLGTTTKAVKSSILTLKGLVALQEAMERIETLEQRLNDAGIN